MVTEYFFKGNMWTTLTGASGIKIRSIQRNNMVYNVMDAERTVIVSPNTGSSWEKPKSGAMIATGSGTAQFNGKNLPYEEYRIKGSSDLKLQLFVDGNKLAGIRNIMGKTKLDQIILVLDQNVPNSMFEIPAGYKKIDMPKELAGLKDGKNMSKELADLMAKIK